VNSGDLVVIKPNLTTAKSGAASGVTTRPDIVEALIQAINRKQPNCRIRIVESDSDGRIAETFVKLGYAELCAKFSNVETVDLGKQRQFKIVMPSFSRCRLIEIPSILMEMNVFINVANLKRHIQERLTCVWKNVYGLPADHLVRMKFHPFMSPVLFDLNMLFWPDLSVVDARVALGGSGPLAGFPSTYNKLIFSRNPLAADLTALALIGERVKEVPSLAYAVRRWRVAPDALEITGDPWTSRPLPFVSPFRFRMGRLSMALRKLSIYAENAFILGWMAGKGAGMGGLSKFASGGVQTLGTSVRMARRVLTKFEVGEQIHG
jgi:uncharacterized protein (DUF362 family)